MAIQNFTHAQRWYNLFKKGVFLILLFFLPAFTLFAQPPVNDIVCDAEIVVPDGSCMTGTTDNATLDVPDAGCGGASMVDVWYSITLAPGSDELTIDFSNIDIPGNGIVMTNLYTFPTCFAFPPTLIPGATSCGGPGPLNFVITGLTGGQTYYFQVGTTPFNSGDFSVCFTEDGPLPCPTGGIACNGAEVLTGTPPNLILCGEGCTTNAPTGPIGNGGCFDFPNETTWHYFFPIPVTGGGPPWSYTITVTSPDMTQPQVAVFQNCPGLTPLACETGMNNSVELVFYSGDFPLDTYWIAVSDAAGGSGQYELCAEPFAYAPCNVNSSINVMSTSYGSPLSGPFLPGEEVEVCLNVNQFNMGLGTNCNFLHGIKPRFGDGWDFNLSFEATGEPSNITVPLSNNTNVGTWDWFSGFSSPTYNLPNGNYPQGTPVGIGWFYIRNPNTCTSPGCSAGDGVAPGMCSDNNNVTWEVCFILTVKQYPQCGLPPEAPWFWDNSDLSISFETFSDSETGSNPNPGCWLDESWSLDLTVNCCAPPILIPTAPLNFCNTGTANFPLMSDLDPNVEYTWTVTPNTVGATACSGGCPNVIDQVLTNNSLSSETVIYTVTPVSTITGCVGSRTDYQVTVNATPQLTMGPALPVCPGNCTNLNTTVVGGQGNLNYFWAPGAFGANPQVCPNETTMYYLTVSDSNGCTDSDSVLVEIHPNPIIEITTDPDQEEICENDPNYPIEITATVTNGGSGLFLYNWGVHGSGLGTLEAIESDFYMVTVTDALTQCSGESFIGITVHPAPVAEITEPDPICGGLNSFCFTGIPDGGVWESGDLSIDGFGCINPSLETAGVKNICYTYTDNFTQCDSTICVDITISSFPSLESPNDTVICGDFVLPVIQGSNLPGDEAYFDAPGGTGNSYTAGDVISSSLQMYVYVDDGTGLCGDEVSFNIDINLQPEIDPIDDQEACDSYTLSSISGNELTGDEAYYSQSGGNGTQYMPGDIISSNVTLYIYDETNLAGCSDEESFEITIFEQPDLDPIDDVTACDEYSLSDITGSNLSGNEAYFDQANGGGNQYNSGDLITSDITLYAYDETGLIGCFDEVEFSITINSTPTSDFDLPSAICISDGADITYTGNASGSATYDWNFNGGTIISGSGQGPYQIEWSNPGTYNISLTVEEDDCSSAIEEQSITVDPELGLPLINCTSNTNSVEFTWPDVAGATAYNISVLSGPNGVLNGNTYTISGLMAGQSVEIEVEAIGSGACGNSIATLECTAQDCPPIVIDIDPVADLCHDFNNSPINVTASVSNSDGSGSGTWSGNFISTNGTFDVVSAGPGNHVVTYTFDEVGCTFFESITINISSLPFSAFSINDEICIGSTDIVTYQDNASINATYNWDFGGATIISGSGQGPYEISWPTAGNFSVTLEVTENGCTSSITNEIITVFAPLEIPVISCNSSTDEIVFSWNDIPGASGYIVNVINGPLGVLNGTTYTVSGLLANDMVTIEVIALGNSLCGNSSSIQSCNALDCLPIAISIDPVNSICLDGNNTSINLNAVVTGSGGTGTGSWSPSAVVDPIALGAGLHNFVYTFEESGCTFMESIDVEIFQSPNADFTITPIICQGGTATVTYTGAASFNASYNWIFNGGTIVSGTGQGPYEISWANPGTFNVTLEVIDNGCNSEIISMPIQVDQPLALPVINCNSSSEQIEFSWNNVPGASGYQVNVINGPSGIQNGNTYTVSGLLANDMVTIEVIAINTGPCGNSSAIQTCNALDCPPVSINIDPVNSICLDGNNPTINLNAVVSGSNGSGTGSWSPSAIIDPLALGAGVHSFVYTFDEVGCTFNESIDIEIFQSPVADFSITPVICEGDNATISFNGTATINAIYNWNFNGGTIISGSGQGPYEISWANQGVYNVSLEVIDNNCNSNFATSNVQVDQPLVAPVIACNSTAEEIEFSWNDIPGASGYIINVISGPNGIQNGNTYTVSGLLANDMVTIEVVALNNGPCGNSSTVQSCNALDCPSVSINIDPVNNICLDGNNSTINLNAIVSGSNGSGSGSWSPSAIVDPNALGSGTHSFVYTFDESGCTFSESINIEIFQSPVSDLIISPDICLGDNASITFNGTASLTADYNWNFDGGSIVSGSGQGPYEINWVNPGVYSVSLEILENGCNSNIASASVEVNQPLPDPVINCNSSTEQIEFTWNDIPGASGYIINVISGPGGLQNGNTYTVSGLQANDEVSIEVIAIDNGPCPNSSSIQSCNAMDCPVISIDIDPVNSICLDGTNGVTQLNATVTGSNGSGMGIWTPLATVDPVLLGPGVHIFTYTFEEVGCMYSESISITINDLPTAEAGNTAELSCTVDNIQLSGFGSSTGLGIDLLWTGPGLILDDQTLTPTINQSGTFYLSVFDNNTGCSSIDSVEITLDDNVPIAIAGPDSSLTCNFPNIQLQGSGSMGIDFEYEWQGPAINVGNMNEISPEINIAGTYILIVTDVNNGCASFADTVIIVDNTQEPMAVVNPIGATNLDCNSQTVLLDGDGSSTTDVIYQWIDPSGNPIPGANAIEYEANLAGVYTLLVTNPISGCFNSATYEIINTTDFPLADAGMTQQLDCTISSVSLDGSLSDNGPTISYLWDGPAGGIIGSNTTPIISVNLPGIYELTVTNSFNGCSTSATVVVTEDLNGPVSDAGTDVELDCDFNTITLSGANSSTGPNYSYQWLNPNGEIISTDLTAATNETGIYSLVVTDSNNDCIDVSFVSVLEQSNVPTAVNLEIAIPSCFEENDASVLVDTVFGGTQPYIYSLDGINYTTVNQFNNLESGQYTLSIEDAGGCQWDSVIVINSPTEVTLNLGADQFIHLGEQADITAENTVAIGSLDTIIWSPSDLLNCLDSACLEVQTGILETTTFNAVISDANGCSDSDDITIYVRWDNLIYVPSIFTPNDDGYNDLFLVYGGVGITQINHFRIFDRWGEVVFEQKDFQPNDTDSGWDGRFRGQELTPAVFVYYVEVLLDNGNIERISGDVTLMR